MKAPTLTLPTRGRGQSGTRCSNARRFFTSSSWGGRNAQRSGWGAAARTAFAVFLTIGLSASGPYMGSLSPPDLARIRTVAIISAVGESFAFERVRPSTFEWSAPPDTRYLEVSDWKIDDNVTREVTSLLSKRVTIKKVFFQRADFGTWNYAILRQNIFKLNGDPGIDAYILILRDWHYDAIGHSVHDLQGLGLYRRELPSGENPEGIYASYRVVVIDANTGAIFASREASMPDGSLPWMQAPASLWPKTPNDLTDVQQKTLSADLTRLIDDTLPRTLAEIRLSN